MTTGRRDWSTHVAIQSVIGVPNDVDERRNLLTGLRVTSRRFGTVSS